jgi:hypothetical protein
MISSHTIYFERRIGWYTAFVAFHRGRPLNVWCVVYAGMAFLHLMYSLDMST